MIKSNINISSNIYIRRHRDLYFDKQYIEQVVGANRLKEIKNRYSGSLSSIKLNKAQDEIANGTVKCSYDKSGEISYGPVLQNGSMCWENRCENISCAYYKICSTEQNFKAISREPVPMEDTQEEDDLRQVQGGDRVFLLGDDLRRRRLVRENGSLSRAAGHRRTHHHRPHRHQCERPFGRAYQAISR